MHINTEIASVSVEIEDREYPIAEKTVRIADKLIEAQRECEGMPEYKLWLAQLKILLGADAFSEIFCAGKDENIDRIQAIYAGVTRAFEYNSEMLDAKDNERRAEAVRDMIAPLNRLMQLAKDNGAEPKNVIRRG